MKYVLDISVVTSYVLTMIDGTVIGTFMSSAIVAATGIEDTIVKEIIDSNEVPVWVKIVITFILALAQLARMLGYKPFAKREKQQKTKEESEE